MDWIGSDGKLSFVRKYDIEASQCTETAVLGRPGNADLDSPRRTRATRACKEQGPLQ